ncbi:hypothetical protein SpCBS45565_g00094 [Spizellomyces sp. 'palustris']|nr:hypothetical protein SpCBS45565_g00094 [Spizellomyces sp. 'palustris']
MELGLDQLIDGLPATHVSFETLRDFVKKRIGTFQYIIKMHEGNSHFLSTVIISNDMLVTMHHEEKAKVKKRVTKWFHLGYSIGTILGIPSTTDFVRAFSQLVSEYENSDNDSRRNLKRIFSGKTPRGGSTGDQTSQPPDTGVYTYMDTPHLPFDIDHVPTVLGLFEVLTLAYSKFAENSEACRNQSFIDAVMKIDGKIKKIIGVVMKDLDFVAKNRVKEELDMLLLTPPELL